MENTNKNPVCGCLSKKKNIGWGWYKMMAFQNIKAIAASVGPCLSLFGFVCANVIMHGRCCGVVFPPSFLVQRGAVGYLARTPHTAHNWPIAPSQQRLNNCGQVRMDSLFWFDHDLDSNLKTIADGCHGSVLLVLSFTQNKWQQQRQQNNKVMESSSHRLHRQNRNKTKTKGEKSEMFEV